MAEQHGGGAAAAAVAPTDAVLLLITCLFIGLCTQQFLGRVLKRIPYTALLLAVGLGIGLMQAIPPKSHKFTGDDEARSR